MNSIEFWLAVMIFLLIAAYLTRTGQLKAARFLLHETEKKLHKCCEHKYFVEMVEKNEDAGYDVFDLDCEICGHSFELPAFTDSALHCTLTDASNECLCKSYTPQQLGIHGLEAMDGYAAQKI